MHVKETLKSQSVLHNVGATLLVAGLLIGCSTATPATQVPPTQAPIATEAATTEPTAAPVEPTLPAVPAANAPAEPPTLPDTGMAVVEQIELRVLESFPVQIHAVVTGYLPDGCTTMSAIGAKKEGTTFHIYITTDRPADAMCTMQIVNFEEVVPLDVATLPAGSYQLVVNDLSTTFDLPGGVPKDSVPIEGGTSTNPVAETETGYVLAQVDVPIYDAPLENGNEIGLIAGGQIARVTGASPDGAWWRVICPDDTVGDCWVSAAPEMTVPTSPPQ